MKVAAPRATAWAVLTALRNPGTILSRLAGKAVFVPPPRRSRLSPAVRLAVCQRFVGWRVL